MSIDPLRLVQQQAATRPTHSLCPTCQTPTRASSGTCVKCQRTARLSSLSSLTLEALLFRRDAINAELARRAEAISAALSPVDAPQPEKQGAGGPPRRGTHREVP